MGKLRLGGREPGYEKNCDAKAEIGANLEVKNGPLPVIATLLHVSRQRCYYQWRTHK